MNCEMKNAKKLFSILIIGVVVCTHTYNDYQTCHAAEAVVAGGLANAGVALLGLGAIAGVGMELDNNRRFNELSDDEKQRIENGLATNFEDVALQRGASLEKIKNWTTDLRNGVLDKASECWGIFKDWIKDVNLVSNKAHNTKIVENGLVQRSSMVGMYNGVLLTQDLVNAWGSSRGANFWCVVISNDFDINAGNNRNQAYLCYSYSNPIDNTTSIAYRPMGISITKINGVEQEVFNFRSYDSSTTINNMLSRGTIVKSYASVPCIINGEDMSNYDEPIYESLFSTNTDYLEKLKGQDEDVIDVIDVTDIKNPIIESRPNSLANINWNRGTRRTNNNNDDDDNKMVTGLVPMDVWYEQIDDEQEQMQNAVVVYDNYIQEHPEEKDTYFISTAPVTNINNYFNTLPVVNLPAQGTVVNNNYEYNNYNNNNVTIYQEPYSAGIIPTFPDFSKKFPFCIPFDLYEFFVVFLAEKEAPKIEVPFPVLDNTNHQLTVEHITIDLSGYEYLSDVLRIMLFVLFCVGLMILTRQLIKG